MKKFRTIDDIPLSGKRVLLRTDLNVPMKDENVTDMTRIERTIPTIRELCAKGATVVVLSHFGRPKGHVVEEMSLAPVAKALGLAMSQTVGFSSETIGQNALSAVDSLPVGSVIVMENLRFHAGEEQNDVAFAFSLAELGEVYVNDAFSAAHRAHASTEAITHLLPSVAGRLMQSELEALENALEEPEKPVAAIVGGAKVSSKMKVLNNLIEKVDILIIGGGMANTFLYAKGFSVGASLCEKEMADTASQILKAASEESCEIILPVDAVVAREFAANAPSKIVTINTVPDDGMILDVGPTSIERVNQKLASCKTLVWNGPMGAFELDPFDRATNRIAKEAAKLTTGGNLLSVAGGGDTVAALANAKVVDQFSYVSTAGGAFLEWLEGKELPGVAALEAQI